MEHHGQLPPKFRAAIREARKAQGRSQLDLVLVPRNLTAMVNSFVRASSDPDAPGAAQTPWFEGLVDEEG